MITVCPAAVVAAPQERVWQLLTTPATYDTWIDGHVERIEPPGPARPGQVVEVATRALGRKWRVRFDLEVVDAGAHVFGFRGRLPLGIRMTERITMAPVESGTRVQYG